MNTMVSKGLIPLMLVMGLGCPASRSEGAQPWTGAPARETPDWIRRSVIYEIFPRQFSETGDFAGITARLDELKALGVDVLWLMPVHPVGRLKAKGTFGSPYAVRDYYAVNPDYGTKEDLHRLIDAAHARGLKLIIDIVANHTAWDSVMMANPSLYKQDAQGHVISPKPDWTDVAGLNYANPETHRYMRDMLKYWATEFKVDGFRCDVAGEVPTDFWNEVRQDLDAIRPGMLLLAESTKPELLLKAFDLDYAWPMLTTLNRVLMDGAPATALRHTWEVDEQAALPKGAVHLRISDNHDEARAVSRFGWKAAQAASALMFTLDGVPLIYNGMEVGDASESGDPALFEKVPVFWHPKKREDFRGFYHELIELRRHHDALIHGSVVWLGNSAPNDVVTFLRQGEKEDVLTIINFSNRPESVSVGVGDPGAFTPLMGATRPAGAPADRLPALELGAFDWRVFSRPASR